MHQLKVNGASFILANLLIISSLFTVPCSSFLYEKINYELVDDGAVKPPKPVNIFSSIEGDLVVGNQINVTAQLDVSTEKPFKVRLICEGERCESMLGGTEFEERTLNKKDEKVQWSFELKVNGPVTVYVRPPDAKELDENIQINNAHSVKELKVGKSHALETWSMVVGYIYFIAWMVSLYPILITNFNRKSVTGLNLDFVALNTTGYLAYAVYNVCLATVDRFQEAYFAKFRGSQIPVQLNDILFATHGFVVNVLICVQCIFYERGDQKLTDIAKGLLIAVYSPAAILTLLFFLDGVNNYYYISFFSYVKLLLTLCKYIPQAYFNYKRKSTKGWSVYYCLLDFVGGSFSVLQMLMNSINQDDFRNFTGNIGKVGLGLVSISFDVVFMVQHYVLYRHREEPILESPRRPSNYGSSKQFPLKPNLKNGVRNPGFEESP